MAPLPGPVADRPLLIAVTDVASLSISVESWARAVYAGGVDLIQIREGKRPNEAIADLARRILRVAPGADCVQINGLLELASELGSGLHLPESAPIPARLPSPSSRSVHSLESASASDGFDFLVAGHVFATPSHAEEHGRGLDWLKSIVNATPLPVVAIGGIDASNAAACIEAGAAGVAVIRALNDPADPEAAARQLRSILNQAYERTIGRESQMTDQTNHAITITLNGMPVTRPAVSTITSLLAERDLVDRLVVVEVNGTIVPRSSFGDVVFNDGDVVEIVHFVGGG